MAEERFQPSWEGAQNLDRVRYTCGYCGTDTTPAYGWKTANLSGLFGFVGICTSCNRPSFIIRRGGDIENATPSVAMGKEVEGLPNPIHELYYEARASTSAAAYTAAVLTCRKILMHIAVEKGADEGKSFLGYVNYLSDEGYIPREGIGRVDYIRTRSNEANHEIVVMSDEDAETLITFTEMLLRLVYEFKNRLPPPHEVDKV